MAAPTRPYNVQKVLANTEPSTHGTKLAFLSASAEDERERIHKRASGGGEGAGRDPGPEAEAVRALRKKARERLSSGESARAIARDMGVAHTTVARVAH
jgi:DNA invertase Pin-like site-specific DNA recombinase